jgi:2-C-methyl-D-erythritol 4-phosphate cytidylyltransferase
MNKLLDNTSSMASQKMLDDGLWFIVPAAGIGQRMGAAVPKQYLPFANATILETTLNTLLAIKPLAGIVVAIHPKDTHWSTLPVSQHAKVYTVTGGDERADSVLSALDFLHSSFLVNESKENERRWVLVHDAARPCISPASIYDLVNTLADDDVGGILGVNSSDTLKRVNDQQVIESTVDRSDIWQAQTPQMFRYGLLRSALNQAIQSKQAITDEASALELAGYTVNIVAGRRDNIKITQADDLPIAEAIYKTTVFNKNNKLGNATGLDV